MGAVKRRHIAGTIAVFVLILAVFIGNFLFDISETPRIAHTKLTESGKETVGEIYRRVTIEQEVPYHAGDLGISIRFATYGRRNLGNVRVKIVGETSGFVYADLTDPVYEFKDNTFKDFAFVEDRPQEDETLKVRITATSTIGHALTIWTTDGNALPDCALFINGEEKDVDLAMQSFGYSDRVDFAWPILALGIVSIVLGMIMVCCNKVKLQNKYFVIALSLGLIFIFVMTPFSIPDEQVHYQSAFKWTNVLSFRWDDLSKGEARFFDYTGFFGHYNVGTAYDRVLNELFAPPPENGSEMVGFSAGLGYPPMLLPQTIGLLIGRLLGANFWIAFYLGRLTNLLFFILCVYFAIRIAPRFKLLFCMVGLMPMALQQAASFSYDTFINGMSILMFAFLLRALDKKGTIRSRDILPIAIIGALLAPSKIIYVSLLFIMFALPAKRFADKKHYWLSLATVMCSAMIVLLLFQLKSILSASTTAGAPSKNWEGAFNYSFADFIERPMVILRVYYLSFRTMIWMWFEQAIGHVLSGQTMIIDQWCVSVYLILLVLSAFGTRNERTTTGRERFVFAVSALLPVLLLMVIMLVSWTTNTYDTIQGVQGRYFIPCVPLALMCLNSRLVRIKKPISKYLIMTGILVNLSALQQVLFKTLLS